MKLSYPTLKRWLGPGPMKSVQFVELAGEQETDQRLKVALPNGLWA
ncbi:hypothetical protein VDG1235_683 [Verrucomicrobiia bacterium DG1235]|nr:hypothetical protein VDG1235_683 [Verrucomicrobiae bacterium DG1235]